MLKFLATLLLLTAVHVSTAQNFTLLKDINGSSNGSSADNYTPAPAGITYFTAEEEGISYLYKTDGTTAGTVKADNIRADRAAMIFHNGMLYFSYGTTLMKTDGTAAGTSQVKTTGTLPVYPNTFIPVNGKLVFIAQTTTTSSEPWVTDGTDAGTFMLKDIMPGTGFANIYDMTEMNGYVYFNANDGVNGYELWRTDGTTANTVLFKNINTAAGGHSNPNNLINVSGLLYFAANNNTNGMELWKSDGTAAGTVIVRDITAGAAGTSIQSMAAVGTTLYFGINSGASMGLWKSSGTSATTVAVKTGINASPYLINIAGTLYFSAELTPNGLDLWKSNGTLAGTVQLSNISNINANLAQLKNLNGKLAFVASENTAGQEVWISDGTVAGTKILLDPTSAGSSSPYYLTVSNGKLFFTLYGENYNSSEPWISDGTAAGTTLLKNINYKTLHGILYNDKAVYNNELYFNAADTTEYGELWKTDGTTAGTQMVKNSIFDRTSKFERFTNVNGTLYFVGGPKYGSSLRRDLWKSDGTAAGTVQVKAINDYADANADNFTALNSILYFTADNGINGYELWRSDGTTAGTYMVKDILPGAGSSYVELGLIAFNNLLFFCAQSGDGTGYELWRSDGTSAGTYMFKDIYPGANNSLPMDFTIYNNQLFFSASNINGSELWKSDGTVAGTVQVKDLYPGTNGSQPAHLTVFNNSLFFIAYDVAGAFEPWISDGTSAGTLILKDINPGLNNSGITAFYPAASQMYFLADNGSSTQELWRTDGTAAGTFMVKDIGPFANPQISLITVHQNEIFFQARESATGTELWTSDGTDAGTAMVTNFTAGAVSSDINFIGVIGTKLIVSFGTPEFGRELHTEELSVVLPLSLLEFNGRLVGNDAQLSWKTENEINTRSFELQRSFDARNYNAITSVAAANTGGTHFYSHTDPAINKPGVSTVYYRLKQTDTDGRFTYSPIVKLNISQKGSTVNVYPNPVKDKLVISLTAEKKMNVQAVLTNSTGQTISRYQWDLLPGNSNKVLDVSGLPAGIYYMLLNDNNGWKKEMKIVKQ